MNQLELNKIAKASCIAFLFYILWFKYSFRQMNILLYATVFVAGGCMLYELWTTKKDLLKICPVGVLMNLVMCVYSIVTGIWVAKNQDVVISLSKTSAAYATVCIVICYVSKMDDSIDWIVNALIAVNIVVSISLIVKGYPVKGYGYVLGPEQNPNLLGNCLILGLFSLAYKSRIRNKKIYLYFALALLFAYSIINSGSRKSLLAMGIICALWIYPLFKDTWKSSGVGKRVALLLLILLLIGSVVYYFATVFTQTDLFKRMQILGDDSDLSSVHRKLYYSFALDYFSEYPVFGIGLGQFQFWNPYHQMSHSTYAEAISSWGLVGCLLYFTPVMFAGFSAVRFSFASGDTYVPRILLAVLIMEAFLGTGQVWFYEIEHLITWTLVHYLLSEHAQKMEPPPQKTCKYIKS